MFIFCCPVLPAILLLIEQQKINIIKQSSIQADFNSQIKQMDAEAALGGYIKGNPIFTIFKQLGISDDSKESQNWRRGLIIGLLGSQVMNQLSQTFKNFIPKAGAKINNKTSFQGDQLIYK
jgi:hypothetical protein